ncbi:MAG TPA: hypothetical protein PLH23_14995 [Hyphomonadaceae bacterium]|nr:hypothetical protein [Hyphomonadaceae bacterium]HPI49578.1 hypothetical protein [Hyphomonadaceae bacterium]
MNVELAEERILLLPDKLGAQQSEGRAWSKRTDAFGAFAKLGGFLNKPKDEDYEVVYRELRLQPFWRLSASSTYVYERQRQHKLKVGVEVEAISLGDQKYPAANREVAITVTECCNESTQRDWLFDGITKKVEPTLKSYVSLDATPVTTEELNEKAKAGAIIVPPQAKASMLTRDVISQAIRKIEADRILEEKMQIDAIDLYYRPVYAVRYKWQGKEAVVEVDAVTGETKTGGTTFEAYVGKLVDRDFLLDAGAEALNTFIPGVNLAKIIVVKGLNLKAKA